MGGGYVSGDGACRGLCENLSKINLRYVGEIEYRNYEFYLIAAVNLRN